MKHRQAHLRNTMLIFAISAIVAALFLYVYFYLATSGLVDRTLEARKNAAASQAMGLQGKEVIKLHEVTKQKRERLLALFVPAENAVAVIQAIESVGDLSGAAVSISSIKAALPANDREKTGQVSASVGIAGAWTDVMHAIELFETLPYQKTMRNLNLNFLGQTEGKDPVGRWQASFDISVATIQKP